MRTQFDVFRAFCRVNAEGAAASRPGQDRRPEACRPGQDAQFASSLSPPWNKRGGAVPRAQPSSSAWRSSQRSCEAERAQQLAAQGKTGVVKPAAQGKTRSLPPPFLRPGTKGGRSASCPAKFKCLAKLPKKKKMKKKKDREFVNAQGCIRLPLLFFSSPTMVALCCVL